MTAQPTWLTPVFQAWTDIVGNPPAQPGRMAKVFGPLRKDGQLPAEVVASLRAYLEAQRKSKFLYVKIENFVSTWKAWVPPPPSRYVPPVRKSAPVVLDPKMTGAQMRAEIEKLRAAHPGSIFVQSLERLYAKGLRGA